MPYDKSLSVTEETLRQISAALCASLSSFSASSAFAWIAPRLVRLKSKESEIPLTPDESSWVVAIIFLGNLVVIFPTVLLVDKLGRKPLLLATCPLFLASWIIILCTRSVNMLYTVRFIQGLGMGIVFMVLPLYLGEVAGPSIRGAMGYFFPGFWYAGSLFEYVISPYVGYQTIAWITLSPPIVFFLTFLWFPESPYLLLIKGKEEKAGKSLAWLRGKDTVEGVKEELDAIRKSVTEEAGGNWRSLLKSKVGRKSLLIVTLIAATCIMCGATAMFSYSTDTFTKIGGGLMTPDEYTILMCSVLLVFFPLSGVAVDRMGRRPILMVSAVGSAFCLGCTSLFLYLATHTSLDLEKFHWVPHFTIILYTVLIGTGVEAIVSVLQAELFANNTRGSASCISFFFISIMSIFCLKMYQVIGDGLGLCVLYGLFALCAALGAVYIYFFFPETKGKTFAEIQEMLTKKSNPTPTDTIQQ